MKNVEITIPGASSKCNLRFALHENGKVLVSGGPATMTLDELFGICEALKKLRGDEE